MVTVPGWLLCNVEVETGRAVSRVIMRSALALSGAQRQHGLCTIECLNLCLLIHTENDSVFGRLHIRANNIDDLSANCGSSPILNVFSRCGRKSAASISAEPARE